MTWLSKNLGWMVTFLALVIGGAVGYGRVTQICTQVQGKADRIEVTREMDRVHTNLGRIEQKIDALILQGKQ